LINFNDMMTKEEILKLDPSFLAYEEDIQEYFDVEIPNDVKERAEKIDNEKKLYREEVLKITEKDEKNKAWERYYDMPNGYNVLEEYVLTQVGYPKSVLVDQEGGGEGDGEYCHWVRYYPELNFYLKVQANYYSYNGVDFDYAEVYEVEPKEVVVTQYHKK